MPTIELTDLDVPLADLLEEDASTLAEVMRRVFDPDERDKLTVSAFGSAL